MLTVRVEMVRSISGPRSTLKLQPMGFADRLDVGYERKKSEG